MSSEILLSKILELNPRLTSTCAQTPREAVNSVFQEMCTNDIILINAVTTSSEELIKLFCDASSEQTFGQVGLISVDS